MTHPDIDPLRSIGHDDAVVWRTPGLIDLRSFTVVGFNAKPNTTNPIGFFGTGLKISVAVLMRMGATVIVWIGKDKYTFFTKTVDFRGTDFEQIWLRSERWKMRARNIQLPYTTQYGKNWKPWMVFRELESNTIDEGGETWVSNSELDTSYPTGEAGFTCIVVHHPDIVAAFAERDKLFIDEKANPVIVSDSAVTVREGGGEDAKLYYRGVRAKDAVKKTLFTYDFQQTHGLTEDRTFESEYWVRQNLGSFVATCDNERVIRKIITASDEYWEHGLEIPQYVKPSEAFHRVLQSRPRGVSSGVMGYYSRHDPRPSVLDTSPWHDAARPWRLDGDTVVDAEGKELFTEPSFYRSQIPWRYLAEELVRVGNTFQQAPGPEESE